VTTLRRIGYRLLPGEGFSYILHLRPREWPIMAAHTSLGFFLAVGLAAAFGERWIGTLAYALVLWVVCLNGGTLAINSAFDRDTGDIGYLDAPPPVPRYLFTFGIALMAAGQLGAVALPRAFGVVYAVCFALSVLYSVPPFRLKAVAGADWLINMVGFGTLTPYAGWAATARALPLPELLALLAFCPLFAALYPLTQLYQLEEDRARGDRTLAIMLGVRMSLAVALGAVGVAFTLFTAALAFGGVSLPRASALLLAGAAWVGLLVRWLSRAGSMGVAAQKRGMYAALGVWGVTDVAALIAFG
jgi:4-hydroxybenzoate polyprenyltransferase